MDSDNATFDKGVSNYRQAVVGHCPTVDRRKSSGNGQAQQPEVKRWFFPLFEISLRAKARVSPAPQLCGENCEGFSLAGFLIVLFCPLDDEYARHIEHGFTHKNFVA